MHKYFNRILDWEKKVEMSIAEALSWPIVVLAMLIGLGLLANALSLISSYDSTDVARAGVNSTMAACFFLIAIFFALIARWKKSRDQKAVRRVRVTFALPSVLGICLGCFLIAILRFAT